MAKTKSKLKEVHVHKYRKTTLTPSSKTVVFRCMLPDCSHYVYPNMYKGRKCVCWRCGSDFTIEREHQKMAKPHCSDCIVRKGGKTHAPISNETVTDLLNDLGIFD
jgi:hypothetical protein